MRTNTSIKYSSSRSCAGKGAKTPTKHSTKRKPKWRIVGDKVQLEPGEYTIDDFQQMLNAIHGERESLVPRKGKDLKRTYL